MHWGDHFERNFFLVKNLFELEQTARPLAFLVTVCRECIWAIIILAIGHSAIGLLAIGHSVIKLLSIGHLAIGILAIALSAIEPLAIGHLAMSILAINVNRQSDAVIFHYV